MFFLKPKKNTILKKKRQWGTEKDTTPLPYLHDRPSNRTIAFSRLAIVLTIFFWVLYVFSVAFRQLFYGNDSYQFTIETFWYLVVVTFLTFSALMYLVSRQGALQRFSTHLRVPRALLDKHFAKFRSSITVLVPSYNEETEVIRKTLLSAALQEYPIIRIVLLIDDKDSNLSGERLNKLDKTRQLAKEIEQLLARPHKRFTDALKSFETKKKHSRKSVKDLANHYIWAAKWLNNMADKEETSDHVEIFFANNILRDLANDLSLVSQALKTSYQEKATLSNDRLHQLYQRLVWIFGAELDTFERKQYASLSHESNKAMNLNSYIGLMGGRYNQEITPDGPVLIKTKSENADLVMPNSDFILTLDADSMLLKDYCLRLVYYLEQPDNKDVAITQTPYSSFRGASTRIERLAGATTDIQHILHQGMSYYGATFWVGANAIIRKKALDDICVCEWSGGFEIKRYIQDNTVIEDTESSIDLALHGWRMVNYPERLSYSATPPDFGSLIIQRRRWANGGLLIMPKLWEQARMYKKIGKHLSKTEVMLRLNYMASIAWSNFGLVFLLAYPYDGRLLSPFVLLAAMPYFIAQSLDLKYCRYHYSDIFRIYGFNLILLPVNLVGVLKSLQQALTTRKIPFARTPKVKNRTVSSLPYVLAPLLIIGFSIFTLWRNIEGQNWGNAAFAGFNAVAASWAVVSYIGLRNMLIDIWLGVTKYLYVDVKPKIAVKPALSDNRLDWKVVLYHGETKGFVPHISIKDILLNSTYASK